MNVTTPFKRLPIVAKSLGIGLFLVSSLYAVPQPKKIKYDTLIYVPVTFYDYHPNGTFGFEQCMSPAGATVAKGLVQDTVTKGGGKPIATALACNTTTPSTYPCACSLNEWFKPTGYKTSTNLKFEQVQTVYKNDTISAFRWTGLQRNAANSTTADTFWTLPGWNGTAEGANLVYYSYLPFRLIDSINGTYSFDRTGNNQFFWLDNIGYGNEGRDHNFSFTMELHQEFTYQGDATQTFQFSGDDDVWVYINGKLALDLGGVHGEQQDGFTLNATKATELGLETGKKYWLDVFYTERHTIQSNCKITSNLLRPYLDTIRLEVDTKNLCPGDTVDIIGKIFDKDSIEMVWLEDSIRWEVVDPPTLQPGDKLLISMGKKTRFTATQAWRNITVKGWVYDPYLPAQIKSATVTFSTDVCKADHIVIEGSPTPRKYIDNPLREVIIGPDDTLYNKLYAVVRDSFGNLADTLNSAKWFTSSTATTWTSANTKIATVQGENNKKYHGTATRADTAGLVVVTASDGTLKPGTVKINVSDFYIVSLRLVDLKTGKVVDTVKVETDSTGKYKIQGLKSTFKNDPSNPSAWIDVNADVNLKDTLKTDCDLTKNGGTWDYCPSNHGKGRVILTNPNDSKTDTTILPVVAILSKPKLYLEIITPAPERIAGDTLKFRAYIKNDDGLIPIPYCFGGPGEGIKDSIAYFDNLGRGGAAKPEPFTLVNDKLPINFDFEKYRTSQCFQNGSDTFGMVFYYAPYNKDSVHIIRATAGPLQTEPVKFTLLPGPLYTLKLEDNNWVEQKGPIELHPENDVFSTLATGYDKFGNRIGHQPSEWSVTNTLDPAKLTNTTGEKTSYRTLNETDGLRGDLVAQAKGIHDSIITTRIEIIVLTPKSVPIKAVTKDVNGNGVLDLIEVTFHKTTNFTMDDGNLSIVNSNPSVSFTVDSIKPADASGRTHYIYLSEADKSKPQTGWTPKMKFSNFSEVIDTTVTVDDGAAPVVWKASKKINSASDRKKDVISIVLSEKISKGGASNLVTVESDPPMVFKIWEKVNGAFVYEDSMLVNIANFDNIKDSANLSVLLFKMTNGHEITSDDWVNIFYENKLIADEKSNYTHELNQRVRFVVLGDIVLFSVIPSPAVPTTQLTGPGEIKFVPSKKQAMDDIKKAGGGTIFKFTLSNTSDSIRVDIKVKVYDVIGNQVASLPLQKNVKVLKDDDSDSTLFSLLFEFGGVNEKGMKVAPGQYKAIAWINYSSKLKSVKMSKVFGFKKFDFPNQK
jgi:fibro-slime domain-containing protein